MLSYKILICKSGAIYGDTASSITLHRACYCHDMGQQALKFVGNFVMLHRLSAAAIRLTQQQSAKAGACSIAEACADGGLREW